VVDLMTSKLSRRDFLKLAGLGLGALALRPFKSFELESLRSPKRLPPFPNSEIIARVVTTDVVLRSRPTNDLGANTGIAKLPADYLVEWWHEVVGNVVGGWSNQTYLETKDGFIYSSMVQPTRNLPNIPITEIPAGQLGFWAEVTVPYIDLAHEGNIASPWLKDMKLYNFQPRLYYSQVVWIDQIRQNNGFVEYRWNEDAYGQATDMAALMVNFSGVMAQDLRFSPKKMSRRSVQKLTQRKKASSSTWITRHYPVLKEKSRSTFVERPQEKHMIP
jgi:hypothetical protein